MTPNNCPACGSTEYGCVDIRTSYCFRCGTINADGDVHVPKLRAQVRTMREALELASPEVRNFVHCLMFTTGITESTMTSEGFAALKARKDAHTEEFNRTYKPGQPGKDFEW